MRFVDSFVDARARYSLGMEEVSSTAYLSIPVANALTDYEEYYSLSGAQYAEFMVDGGAARSFAEQCRRREHDDRLLLRPGVDRGTPR